MPLFPLSSSLPSPLLPTACLSLWALFHAVSPATDLPCPCAPNHGPVRCWEGRWRVQIRETKEGLAQNKCSVKQGLSRQVRSGPASYYLPVWQETNQWTALKRSSRTYSVGHTQMPPTSVCVHPPPPSSPAASEPTPKERSLEAAGAPRNGPPLKCPGWWEQAGGRGRGGQVDESLFSREADRSGKRDKHSDSVCPRKPPIRSQGSLAMSRLRGKS